MASTAISDEWILDVPRQWMTQFKGFVCDIGGSVMKVIYRHKDDWNELKDSDKGRLRFLSVSRHQRSDAMAYVKVNCHFEHDITNTNNLQTVFGTGFGSSQFANEFETEFAVRIENITEFDCFVHAFRHLVREIRVSELLYPDCVKAENDIQMLRDQKSKVQSKMEDHSTMKLYDMAKSEKHEDKPEKFDQDTMFPCILAMCGSGVAFIVVEKDGSFALGDGLNRGGRYFCAVGGLLTGATTYDELIDLAAKGDANNVHFTYDDLKEAQKEVSEDTAGAYTAFTEVTVPNYIYTMGKAMGKTRDDFSKEDIAACWLNTYCSDIVQTLQITCVRKNVKNIFWCGSFIKSDVVRHHLTLEFRRRCMNFVYMSGQDTDANLYFLKHGPYLGALGCVLNSVDQFLKPPSQIAAEKKEKETEQQKS